MNRSMFSRYAVVASLASMAAAANAAVDTSVTAAITGVGTDLAAYGALMIAAGVAFFAVKAAGRKLGFWP